MINKLENLSTLARELGEMLFKKKLICTTAESCTGGMVCSVITDIAGSSQWFERAFITYSNQAKHEMLDVPLEVLETFGAVSLQTVIEMAQGALTNSNANLSVAISGIAGPGGATIDKVVGTVCFAFASDFAETISQTLQFTGDPSEVRLASTKHALQGLIKVAQQAN